MTKRDLLPIETLHKLLVCDADAGKLFWRERGIEWFTDGYHTAQHSANIWNSRHAGNEAFTCRGVRGYKHGAIFNRHYKAHRVIWAMHTGAWPTDQIDHINGVTDDNRISNLREVTNQGNGRNAAMSKRNTSGVTGVYWRKDLQKWFAAITIDYRCIDLGTFADKDDAIAARKKAEIEHGFHANHGRTAT